MVTLNDSDVDPQTQLIPNLIDHYAKIKPDALFAEYPIDPMSYNDGYRPITFKDFANAINGIAHWLTENLGHGNGEILAYMGPNDLRYPALVLGAIKANYCMFFPSPRNSVPAHRSLLEKLDCNILLTPVPRATFIGAIQEARSVKTLDIPNTEILLDTEYPHFTYSRTYPEAATDKFAVVHTSGSTGIPKPIIWTHDSTVKHRLMQQLAPPDGYESQEQKIFGKRVYLTLPPFHAAGLAYILFIIPPVGSTAIMPTAAGLPTAEALIAARKQTPFDCALVVPSIVLELAQNPELLHYCSTHLEHIIYAGGDLPQPIGNTVAAKISLMNGYGATEIGMLNTIHSPERDPLTDWRYLHFNPELGMEFRHVSGEEYEAVLMRTPTRQTHQCPFVLFPELQEYHTNDLMVPHPTKPNLWRPSARRDDVIVFLNGEKTNPVSMEQHIVSANPQVTGCIVVGAQRFQAAVLIELRDMDLSVNDRAVMIEKIWPSIEKANIDTPAHARIAKSHILFTSPSKPMPRAGKGTIQRSMAVKAYEREIESLYNDAEKLSQLDATQLAGPGGVNDVAKVTEYIRASILAITGWDSNKFSDEANWFDLGLDSLQAITLTGVLKLGLNLPTLTPNVIYLSPTVPGLTHALQRLHKDSEESLEAKQKALLQERDQLLQELIGQIKTGTTQNPSGESPATHSVILTGSTGQLGTYMLDVLLKSPRVRHVYCLNRDGRARDRQQKRGAAYALAPLDKARVTFWKSDLSQADLGLQSDQLHELQQTTTLIIHNSWDVNFNLSLASFKPHLMGVVNLINFTTHATYSPQLFFISSISSVLGHRTESGLIPENVITTTTPAPIGYANSKYLAEHLLGHAAQHDRSFRSAFARVGQVAGPILSPGLWSKSEWFPSMALSSIHLGALPDTLGSAMDHIEWVPIDLLAEVLVDLALIDSSELKVYHPVNLNPLPWSEVLPIVAGSIQKVTGKNLEIIPLRNWVTRTRQDIELANRGEKAFDEEEIRVLLSKNPAAKLIEFFEHATSDTTPQDVLDTQKTTQASEKLRQIDGVRPEWIQKWVHEWLQ